MAQKIEVQLIDDLDGSAATETISFGYEGVEYEIDLNEVNAERLKDILRIHAEHARRTSGRKDRSTNRVKKASNTEAQTIREWVRAQGHQISDRGRIPNEWVEKYANAQFVAEKEAQAPEPAPVVEAAKAEKPKRAPRKPAAPKKSVGAAATELGKLLSFEEPKKTTTARKRTTTTRTRKSTTK